MKTGMFQTLIQTAFFSNIVRIEHYLLGTWLRWKLMVCCEYNRQAGITKIVADVDEDYDDDVDEEYGHDGGNDEDDDGEDDNQVSKEYYWHCLLVMTLTML